MKKNDFGIFLILGFFFLLHSCSPEKPPFKDSLVSCFDGIKNGDEKGIDCGGVCSEFCAVPNSLEGELYLRTPLNPAIEYTLTGPLIIRDGASLDIPAGMTIKVAPNRNAYIAITQGGKLYAYGTEEQPIVITSGAENPQPGDWGGIILCGKAPINKGEIGRSAVGDIFYGGNDPIDSSGYLRYLRVEYTGATFREETVFSGISFFGVGSYTTVLNVQSLYALGDSYKFFGGTVTANGVVATNSAKNGISIVQGWYGTIENSYLSGFDEIGISIADNESNNLATLKNISLIGSNTNVALSYGTGRGIVNFENLYASNFILGVQVNGEQAALAIEDNEFSISTIQFENFAPNFMATDYNGNNQSFYTEGASIGAGNSAILPDWAINWVKGY